MHQTVSVIKQKNSKERWQMNQVEEMKRESHTHTKECMSCGVEFEETYASYAHECERCVNLAEE
jgi:hypothetical protein